MNLNQVFFAGNLTRDPELRRSQGKGLAIVKFGVACNEYTGKDTTRTTFVDCTCFDKRGEALAKHLKKGSPIFIRGHLSFSTWKAQDGSNRSKLELVVDEWQFCGGKKDKADAPADERGGYSGGHTKTDVAF